MTLADTVLVGEVLGGIFVAVGDLCFNSYHHSALALLGASETLAAGGAGGE